jgi:N-acetylmuramoyl-L-alanine amidase
LVGQRLIIPGTGAGTATTANYTVKSGDTLYLIAQQHQIALNDLLSLNQLSSAAIIVPGQALKLPSSAKAVASPGVQKLRQSDLDLLARLVSAESAGEPFTGQVAVAATILNRLQDKRYPKTIPGIVYQIDFGRYQYSPVLDGRINQPATASAYRAVRKALSGCDPSNGATGFYNPAKTTSRWVRSHPTTAVIGGHVFFNY